MIGGGKMRLAAAQSPSGLAERPERLRAAHLVDELPVDIEQVFAILAGTDDMRIPQLVVKRAAHGGLTVSAS